MNKCLIDLCEVLISEAYSRQIYDIYTVSLVKGFFRLTVQYLTNRYYINNTHFFGLKYKKYIISKVTKSYVPYLRIYYNGYN